MKPRGFLSRSANQLSLTNNDQSITSGSNRLALFISLLTIAITLFWYLIVSSAPIVQAELALGRRDFQTALAIALQELRTRPNADRALMVAGSAALAMQEVSAASEFLKQVSDQDQSLISVSLRERGRIAIESRQVVLAETLLRKSLGFEPDESSTQDQLIYLLTLEGRGWEARDLIFDRLRSGFVSRNHLIVAARPDLSLEMSVQFAQHCLAADPNEPMPKLALAQQAWRDSDSQSARRLVQEVLTTHPELLEAHALLCRILAETGTPDEFAAAHNSLPKDSQSHPVIWLSQGIWAEHQGQYQAAARCFWEALRLNPNLADANYRLSQVLVSLDFPEEARRFGERAGHLTKLHLDMLPLTDGLDLETLPAIVEQLESLGRYWEAAGWCQLTIAKDGAQPSWARTAEARLCRQLTSDTPYAVYSRDPSHQIDLSHFNLPQFQDLKSQGKPTPTGDPTVAKIEFQDDASSRGLIFSYNNGASLSNMESMLEMNGGGVAVLDYDGDHWPDVFFTQGGALPPAPFDPLQTDQLFRNGGRDVTTDTPTKFNTVTEAARLQDLGYGQGVTVGDFDNDGFPDLYVGNIGANQFLHNNGDGTFSDVTASSAAAAGGWTSSCVLADFNQDGWPDLYVVTYLGGETPFIPCDKRARPRCAPLDYPAEPDRFYLSLGDGRFRDLSTIHGLSAPEGRGLGVVAADFDGSQKLSLFVGNDMSENFFFLNKTSTPDDLQFNEQALLSGLALDHAGLSKACMGIAAGDYNQDELLDLFVTNFYRQSNDLYTQQSDGTFRDLSREAKLFEPSFLMLGWGTQFLDADLDGHADLIVANGHVHDPVDAAVPYYMPTQFFRNTGDGGFTELPSEVLGPFFNKRLLGRSLARLDWNRDGADDVCISHLHDPSALLTNRTKNAGNYLSIRLVAVSTSRDAIGTKVRVTAGNQTSLQQLTAGDGFHASNERKLVFGLREQKSVDSIEVAWPSGVRQVFSNLSSNKEYLIIEHRFPIPLSSENQ